MLIVSPLKALTVVSHEKPVVFSHEKAIVANPKAFLFSCYINHSRLHSSLLHCKPRSLFFQWENKEE